MLRFPIVTIFKIKIWACPLASLGVGLFRGSLRFRASHRLRRPPNPSRIALLIFSLKNANFANSAFVLILIFILIG